MHKDLLINSSTILALLPITIFSFQKRVESDWKYWTLLSVAVFSTISTLGLKLSGTWQTDLGTAIWATIAATMVIFALSAISLNEAWRLVPLVSGYMIFLGIMASILEYNSAQITKELQLSSRWAKIHIFMSLATYGFITISAIAAFAAAFQEYSLKAKTFNPLYRLLPSITECDSLMVRLLILSEIILGIGLISGIVLGYINYQQFLHINHKLILTTTAFFVIAILLITHHRIGIRGRRAARYVLCAYLLLTLAYPGVKFVSDILIG